MEERENIGVMFHCQGDCASKQELEDLKKEVKHLRSLCIYLLGGFLGHLLGLILFGH